jgi:hypothetical protein
MTEEEKEAFAKLVQAVDSMSKTVINHERAIGVLLKEVKALKTAAEQKPKIWTP